MPLTQQNQNTLQLPGGGHGKACGVACVVSVLKSLTGQPPADPHDVIFTRIATAGIRRLGSTPANIADYLVAQPGRQVWYSTNGMAHTPLTALAAAALATCNATRVANPAQHPPAQVGGPPYFILFLKVRGATDPTGHFVVSDGFGYMDPGAGGYINANFPHWADFYDTHLTVIVT
jgi:hypothetical protein